MSVSMCVGLPVKTKIHSPWTSTWDLSKRLMAVPVNNDVVSNDIASDSSDVDVLRGL